MAVHLYHHLLKMLKSVPSIAMRLREAGAIILGVTGMQKIGIGVLGCSPNHLNGAPRNPYNTDRYAGGSSTGSAIAVATGFCPISIGCDGGGSVHIPATLCGVVGRIKRGSSKRRK